VNVVLFWCDRLITLAPLIVVSVLVFGGTWGGPHHEASCISRRVAPPLTHNLPKGRLKGTLNLDDHLFLLHLLLFLLFLDRMGLLHL